MRDVAGRQDHFDDQQPAARFHRLPAIDEDRDAIVLVPVMDDVRQQVRITSCWNVLEEIDGFDGEAIGEAARFDQRGCFTNDVREVGENAARSRVTLENRGQQITRPAADVNDSLAAREVTRGGDRNGLVAVEANHRLVEVRRFLRMLRQIAKDRRAKLLLHRGLARFKAIEELLPSSPPPVARQGKCGGSGRSGRVALERFPKR